MFNARVRDSKTVMFGAGAGLAARFTAANNLPFPAVEQTNKHDWRIGTCAYYRGSRVAEKYEIKICVDLCADLPADRSPRNWSFPGYVVDRTPYGVVAHEIGHHVDVMKSPPCQAERYMGHYSLSMHNASGEEAITTYCPNPAEWFAEIFRLFLTNPDLLRLMRPRVYEALRKDFNPVEQREWDHVLEGAPSRILKAASTKIQKSRSVKSKARIST